MRQMFRALTTVALISLLASAAWGRDCRLAVGTVATAHHMNGIREQYPRITRGAVFVAHVREDQRSLAEFFVKSELRRMGGFNEDVFTAIKIDALRGVDAAEGIGKVGGAVAGGLVGLLADKGLAGLAIGGGLGAMAGGHLLKGAASQTIVMVTDQLIIEPAIKKLVGTCELTPAQALRAVQDPLTVSRAP